MMFYDDYEDKTPQEMVEIIAERVQSARINSMIVTLGADGAVYAHMNGEKGWCPARKVEVRDTTGAGDAFCAGAVMGMTYGKTMEEACKIGSTLSASVITTCESVCPHFQPRELGLDIDVID